MKITTRLALVSPLFASFFTLISCEKHTARSDSQEPGSQLEKSHQESPATSLAEEAANMISKEKNLTIVSKDENSILLKNIYSEVELRLTFEEIVTDKKHILLGKTGQEYLKIKKPPTPLDWGKTPGWVPRYQGAKIHRGAMHSPIPDGSIWGNIAMTIPDKIETAKQKLLTQFKEAGMILKANGERRGSHILVFKNNDSQTEKRQVTCTLKQNAGSVELSIQYSYGM